MAKATRKPKLNCWHCRKRIIGTPVVIDHPDVKFILNVHPECSAMAIDNIEWRLGHPLYCDAKTNPVLGRPVLDRQPDSDVRVPTSCSVCQRPWVDGKCSGGFFNHKLPEVSRG